MGSIDDNGSGEYYGYRVGGILVRESSVLVAAGCGDEREEGGR